MVKLFPQESQLCIALAPLVSRFLLLRLLLWTCLTATAVLVIGGVRPVSADGLLPVLVIVGR